MGRHSRRKFVMGAVGAGTSLLTGCKLRGPDSALFETVEAAAGPKMRKDVSTLTADSPEIVAYKRAIEAMRALPNTNPLSWNRQARIHQDHCSHGNWFFLPWHRAYIAHFERIIRQMSGDDDFALPFWDWTRNPDIPALFTDNTSPLYDNTRRATTVPASACGERVVNDILATNDFYAFASGRSASHRTFAASGSLEATPHNTVHSRISGNMGAFMSPLDPIFWLHHCNIDRLWEVWREGVKSRRGASADLPPVAEATAWQDYTLPGFFDPAGAESTMKVSDVLAVSTLGYAYERPGGAPRGASASLTSMEKQSPDPVSAAKLGGQGADGGAVGSGSPNDPYPGSSISQLADEMFQSQQATINGNMASIEFPLQGKLSNVFTLFLANAPYDPDRFNQAVIALNGDASYDPTFKLTLMDVREPMSTGTSLSLLLSASDGVTGESTMIPVATVSFFGHGDHGDHSSTLNVVYDIKRPLLRLLKANPSLGNTFKVIVRVEGSSAESPGDAQTLRGKLEYIE